MGQTTVETDWKFLGYVSDSLRGHKQNLHIEKDVAECNRALDKDDIMERKQSLFLTFLSM